MTRKDYVLLARALRQVREAIGNRNFAMLDGVTAATAGIAGALAGDNPRFDRDRFYRAAGFEEAA